MNRLWAPTARRTTDAATARPFGRAVALTSFSTFVAMLGFTGPLGNAATLAGSLDSSTAGLTWILNSMSVGLAVALLAAGALADRRGRRRVFVVGAWLFAAGSVVCVVAPGTAIFVVGRLLEGVGAAGVIATGLGLVAVVAEHASHRTAAASWWAVSMGAGIALGPVLTGLFDLVERWRAFYLLLVCLGAGTALLARRLFTETQPDVTRPLDLRGTLLMAGGLGLLLVALVEVRLGDAGFALLTGFLAVVCLVGFAASQRRGEHPMLAPALFRRPDFLAATVAALATGLGVIALMSFAATFFVTGLGMTTFGAGAVLAVWSGTSAVAAIAGRRLPARLAGEPQLLLGLVGVGLGMLLLTAVTPAATVWRLLPGLLVAGVASGVLNAGLGRQAVATVPGTQAAVGIGTNNTARYVGSAVGVTLVTLVAARPDGDVAARVAGWNEVVVLAALLSLLGAGAVAVLRRTR